MAQSNDYIEFMNRFLRGEAPTADQFLMHFEHQNGTPIDAVSVGDVAPQVTLADQHGLPRSIDDVMGSRGLLLAFVRSTYWCPYCRNQLAELGLRSNDAAAAGLGVAAVAPDAVERNAEFAMKHSISFPILSDPEGVAIKAYGVHNDKIPPNDLQGHSPLPHPGFFLLSPTRKVLAREFTGDIRHRVSVSAVIAETSTGSLPDQTESGGVAVETPEVRGTIALTASTVYGGQEVGVTIRLNIKPGFHVYADNVPIPYQPIAVELSSRDALLADQRFTFPPATQFAVDGETALPVHEHEIVAHGRIRLRWSPPTSPFTELADFVAGHAITPGIYDLDGRLRYQACSETECYPPRIIEFKLPIEVAAQASAGSPVQLGQTIIPQHDDADQEPASSHAASNGSAGQE